MVGSDGEEQMQNTGTHLRSRSQERSVSVSKGSIAPAPFLDQHSRASSTACDSDEYGDDNYMNMMLEDLEPLEPKSLVSLANGVVSADNDNEKVFLTKTATPSKNKGVSKSSKYHRRSVSDPFDISGLEEAVETTTIDIDGSASIPTITTAHLLPTLPRYPVAETRDLNCWSEPPVDIFKVRGKRYLLDKIKVNSEPYLFRARGCDLLLFPEEGEEPCSMMDR